jgi:hypothetical protein
MHYNWCAPIRGRVHIGASLFRTGEIVRKSYRIAGAATALSLLMTAACMAQTNTPPVPPAGAAGSSASSVGSLFVGTFAAVGAGAGVLTTVAIAAAAIAIVASNGSDALSVSVTATSTSTTGTR